MLKRSLFGNINLPVHLGNFFFLLAGVAKPQQARSTRGRQQLINIMLKNPEENVSS